MAGYAALLRDKFPNLNAPQAAGILLETATYEGITGCTVDNPSASCLQQYGKGRADITRALAPMGANDYSPLRVVLNVSDYPTNKSDCFQLCLL